MIGFSEGVVFVFSICFVLFSVFCGGIVFIFLFLVGYGICFLVIMD